MLRCVCGVLLAWVFLLVARADQAIYTDSLQNGWVSYGWATTIDYNNTSPVHGGAKSIAVTMGSGNQALYVHHNAFDSTPYTHVSFWIHGGTSGGQQLQVQAELGGAAQTAFPLPALAANTWQQFTIPLTALGAAGEPNMDGVWIQDRSGAAPPTFYVDDMSLVALPSITLTQPSSGDAFTAPATINFAASVTARGHIINRVDFLTNGVVLGADVSVPYTFTWSTAPAGLYDLSARVTFDTTNTSDSSTASIVVATNSFASIAVDAQLNRHAISPLIYGVAFASASELAELQAPLNRSGGNSETRYNWQVNAHNSANDWYFESHSDTSTNAGASADSHVQASKTGGAEPMLTIPMIGWTTKLATNRAHLSSFSVAKYGAQAQVDPYWPDAGNGVTSSTGSNIVNDPDDASFQTNSSFQAAFLQHLIGRWGSSTNGGVRYYLMDNEQTIWHSTHRDVHPVGTTMVEIRDKFFDYAGVVKGIDPSAIVLAPEEWGWSGYFYSGYDQQWSGAHGVWDPARFPDRTANGGWDYIPWLLDQFRQRATTTGRRLLDYCTTHVYPQAGEFGDDVSLAMQLKRNRSTRQLWDTNYVDPTWINSVIKLIPRMKSWVAAYYPGTKIGITEYNWGAEDHISGATAQADILGIFGREGLDLATRWTTPAASTPTFKAMKLFRNYDGSGSGFGDTNISAAGPNPDYVSTFAALRSSDRALTLLVINKQQMANSIATVTVTNQLLAGTGQVWQLNAGNTIRRLPDLAFAGNTFTNSVPPQSITMFVLPPGVVPPPQLRPGVVTSGVTFDFWVDGVAGQRYVVQTSADFVNWTPVQTNTLSSSSWHVTVSTVGVARSFYRAQWLPQ
jgi:hypothetical protein